MFLFIHGSSFGDWVYGLCILTERTSGGGGVTPIRSRVLQPYAATCGWNAKNWAWFFQRFGFSTGNGEKLIKTTSTSLFTLVFAKFANFVWVRPTTTMFIIQTVPVSTPKEKKFQGLQVSVGHHRFLRLSCLALQSIGQYSFHTWPQNVRQ